MLVTRLAVLFIALAAGTTAVAAPAPTHKPTDKGTMKACTEGKNGKQTCKRIAVFSGHNAAKSALRADPLDKPSGEVWLYADNLGEDVHANIYKPDGSFHYTNHKRGRHGELGPWQMRKVAFREVRQQGDRFERLAEEPAYAEKLAARYLLRINAQVGGNWDRTVRAYNVGVAGSRRLGRGRDYLDDVRAWARRVGAPPVRE